MAAENLAGLLAAYVPYWVSDFVRAERGGQDAAVADPRPSAVLLIDLAGFTLLTDSFARRGPQGAEQLSYLLNDCFAVLTDTIRAHGGDIVAFAGDGIIAVWPLADLGEAAQRAAQCGLALRGALHAWGEASGRHDIDHRTAIEVGELQYCRTGDSTGAGSILSPASPLRRSARLTGWLRSATWCCARLPTASCASPVQAKRHPMASACVASPHPSR